MNPLVTVGGTLLVLFLVALGLIFVARARKWKPTPIKPIWAVTVICAVHLLAGLVCSAVGRDIHILYWWLAWLPIVAICVPLVLVATTFCVRLFNAALFSILDRLWKKR
jgi:hypothetical protein